MTNTVLKAVMERLEISHRELGRACNLAKGSVDRLVKGQWPRKGAHELRANLEKFLMDRRGTRQEVVAVFAESIAHQADVDESGKKKAPDNGLEAGAYSSESSTVNHYEEEPMLLVNQTLSQEAMKHFQLLKNPFLDDVQSSDDVFQTKSVRFVRHALMDAAMSHGFVAICGESGAGKSTLAEDLEERIKADSRDVVVIRPYVLAMEENDTKGKTLKSSAIADAIITALDPTAAIRQSPQAKFNQVHKLLKSSFNAGRKHVLLIEEAHGLPTATLKHLKRFLELKDGMRRLMGIALIGQPELRQRLSGNNAELREVTQRCAVVELDPLDNELEDYLKHKFMRCGLKYEDVVAPDAADAIRARLTFIPRGGKVADARSMCYPLVVNNLVAKAMNKAAAIGWPVVDAQAIAGC